MTVASDRAYVRMPDGSLRVEEYFSNSAAGKQLLRAGLPVSDPPKAPEQPVLAVEPVA
jgi:hypothetical protein